LAQLNGEPLEATLLRSPLIACASCPCRNVAGGRWLAAAAQTMGATLRPAPEQTPVFTAVAARLRRVLQHRLLTRDAAHYRLVQLLHGAECERVKQVPQLFPERTFIAPPLLPGGLEQGTAQLLGLVHQEGEHHQQGQHHRQVLRAVSVVVFQVVTLIFSEC
jgi:hypothetical protein